jgi:hypothetical protein
MVNLTLGPRASCPHFRGDASASCTSDAGETPAVPGARVQSTVLILAAVALFASTPLATAQQLAVRAGTLIDGKGGVERNAVIAIDGSRIVKLGNGAAESVTYDLSRFTVLPGLIGAHVHIGAHFGKDGRASNAGETPADAALAAAANAYAMLMAGFTTVQSIGQPIDVPLRDAIARGEIAGPRLLTSRSISSPIPSSRPTRCGSSCANRAPTAPT